ncbi:MAG: zinc ribbon domain-containing protein [Lachnospiraceae bacterium]|nr:zinc ribbon domain-containing protein [Lachnospiraceae bacterium]
MKCEYCGNNLGIEDEICPYCGRENTHAKEKRAVLKGYRARFEQTRAESKKRSKSAARIGRLVVIGLMLLLIGALRYSIRVNSDIDTRQRKIEDRIAKEVGQNSQQIADRVREMEKNREYMALSYYMLHYRLRGAEGYDEYFRVFTAAIHYRSICNAIWGILDGFDGYEEKTARDWCDEAAIYISDWNSYVDGTFWGDVPDSPMHVGEHGAFLADIKQETRDIVRVYFHLTQEQADSMWTMDRDALGAMLYEGLGKTEEGTDE